MSSVTHRFENYMRNGMGGWARSQPVAIRALLFLPCLLEYLIVYAFCAVAIAAVVLLDAERQPGLR
jgi:hypothetical protein